MAFLAEKLAPKGLTPYKEAPLVLPDDEALIRQTVQQICDVPPLCGEGDGATPNDKKVALLITIGGTGFGPRDVTPEAVRPLLQKEAHGLVHAMLSYSLGPKGTPYAWLSRPVAGVRGGTLVITVPGSAKAVVECLTPLVDYGLVHALELIAGDTSRVHPTAPASGDGASAAVGTSAPLIPSSCSCCAAAPLPPPRAGAQPVAFAFDPARALSLVDGASPLRSQPSALLSATPSSSRAEAEEPYSLTNRPRNSDYRMVPMAEALAAIEAKSRAAARRVVTVAGGGPGAGLLSGSGGASAGSSPLRLFTTDLTDGGPMAGLPVAHYATADEASRAVEGAVLAAPIVSGVDLPPFRASIKDGYAVLSLDGEGVYPVVSEATAGSTFGDAFLLQTGQVCRVSTGGPVPDGADAVVQVEDTALLEASPDGSEELVVRIGKSVAAGTDVRPIGCDISVGQQVLAKGAAMGPSEIALWHTVGLPPICHYAKPRVAVLSTGNELSAETPLPKGKIYDSNKGMLLAALRATKAAAGGAPIVGAALDGGIARDDYGATREGIAKAFRDTRADVVISTGGVSMGERDHVKAALLSMGATIHFGRVNMKPGKPTTFATIPAAAIYGAERGRGMPPALFFGLPGNPVSAMVCYHVFVAPSLRVLCGQSPRLQTLSVQLTHAVALDRERPEYHRCRLVRHFAPRGALPSGAPLRSDGADASFAGAVVSPHRHSAAGFGDDVPLGPQQQQLLITATSTGPQASHRLLSMHTANGLLVLPVGDAANGARIEAGSFVEAVIIDEIL